MNNELCIQKKMYLLFVKINFALTISTSIHSPLVQTQATNGISLCKFRCKWHKILLSQRKFKNGYTTESETCLPFV